MPATSHPISNTLISWYKLNKRDLPWRNTTDPYKIWLSEIMLQQTQVAQGMSYYLKFIDTFPTVIDLAKAPEDKVLHLWQGLGYYSRARNLHATAKIIATTYKGNFPTTYDEIKNLKGIGDYTAAAITSISYNLPFAVVDGNVYRVLARLFNIKTPINSSQAKKEFQLVANELLNKKLPSLHNNALMEFGALHCKPQNPSCETCTLQTHCLALKHKTVSILPVKDKKVKVKNRYFNYVVFNYKDWVYIQKRIQKDIWRNLYEFYLIETPRQITEEELYTNKQLATISSQFTIKSSTPLKKHLLSHQHIYSTFYELTVNAPIKSNQLIKIKKEALTDYALPQLIANYLKK